MRRFVHMRAISILHTGASIFTVARTDQNAEFNALLHIRVYDSTAHTNHNSIFKASHKNKWHMKLLWLLTEYEFSNCINFLLHTICVEYEI